MKANYFDSLVGGKLLINFRDTEKELSYSQIEFTSWLHVKGYVYKDSKGIIKSYEQYCEQLENKRNVIFLNDDEVRNYIKAKKIMNILGAGEED